MAGESYFSSVPPVLQEYLASVQMQGFTVSGRCGRPPVSARCRGCSAACRVNPSVVHRSDYAGSLRDQGVFAFLDAAQSAQFENPQTLATFVATFTLFPEIFRTKEGAPGGCSDHHRPGTQFGGMFSGKASFNDVLLGVNRRRHRLPEGVEVDFSDVFITVQTSQKALFARFHGGRQCGRPVRQRAFGRAAHQSDRDELPARCLDAEHNARAEGQVGLYRLHRRQDRGRSGSGQCEGGL